MEMPWMRFRTDPRISMAWLKKAELVEVIVNNPGRTRSGTCELCETLEDQPVNEVGRPKFHKSCACTTRWIQMTTQPDELLEEILPEEFPDELV